MRQERIYHILIDRFFPMKKEDANGNFKGGCIESVITHLDYIQNLGMTGIMLTPFYKTATYHGYHTVSFNWVDPHFGTTADVCRLVKEVHKRNMIIVADFVANHCHKSFPLFVDGKHKEWFVSTRNGKYKCFAGIEDLPMFNTKNKEVQVYLTQKALNLCSMGFDAIRLDHATGPTYAFWRYFRKNIKSTFPKVKLIGEVWGRLDFKPRWQLRYIMNKCRYNEQEARQLEYVGILDGVLDFSYQQLLCTAVHKGKSIVNNQTLYKKVKSHLARYPTGFQLWLFLDNHDLNRFLFECGGDKTLLREAIEFSKQWKQPWIMFYGTEKEFTNAESINDGTPYADERVRKCINNDIL